MLDIIFFFMLVENKSNFTHQVDKKKDLFQRFVVFLAKYLRWNLSHPTHQGTREMCRIVQDVGILRVYFEQLTEIL